MFRLLPIARPCGQSFSDLPGDEKTRFCHECGKHVYDLSQRTEAEAQALFREREGQRTCVRVPRDPSGAIRFRAVALAAALSVAGCASQSVQHAAAPTPGPAQAPDTVDLGETIPDVADKCPDQPEAGGGAHDDDDGCPTPAFDFPDYEFPSAPDPTKPQ